MASPPRPIERRGRSPNREELCSDWQSGRRQTGGLLPFLGHEAQAGCVLADPCRIVSLTPVGNSAVISTVTRTVAFGSEVSRLTNLVGALDARRSASSGG